MRIVQRSSLEDALRQLFVLEALDEDGHITDIGRRIVGLPLDPALARSLLAAADLACVPDMLSIAAMLSAESIFTGGRCGAHETIPIDTRSRLWCAVTDEFMTY